MNAQSGASDPPAHSRRGQPRFSLVVLDAVFATFRRCRGALPPGLIGVRSLLAAGDRGLVEARDRGPTGVLPARRCRTSRRISDLLDPRRKPSAGARAETATARRLAVAGLWQAWTEAAHHRNCSSSSGVRTRHRCLRCRRGRLRPRVAGDGPSPGRTTSRTFGSSRDQTRGDCRFLVTDRSGKRVGRVESPMYGTAPDRPDASRSKPGSSNAPWSWRTRSTPSTRRRA
jgi:hypothetical protein